MTGSPLSGEKLPVATNITKQRILSEWSIMYRHNIIEYAMLNKERNENERYEIAYV